MSELILQALMQLFAIGSTLERLTVQSRKTVEAFLRQQVSLQRIPEYLSLYDEYKLKFEGGENPDRAKKKISVSSVKMLRICTEINKELNLRQKYIVFLRLAEFMHSSELEMTDAEKEFLETVADVFNIQHDEYLLFLELTRQNPSVERFDSPLVLITSSEPKKFTHANHLIHDDLEGTLIFIFIRRANIIFLRYTGEDSLLANGQPVDSSKVTVLAQGAVIRSQKMQPLYYNDIAGPFLAETGHSVFRFTCRNLEYVFANGKKGIYPLNFSVQSGNLVGIMGSSGAGKSTLLNVLNGSAKPSSGHITINGNELYAEAALSKGLIGNIPQDDLLIEELSVFQNLYYNTRLCFGNMTKEEVTSRVNAVIDSLGLNEIRDLRVGNVLNKTISGGQRKRLNIGLELVREPAVLFVDEPTSGLSSRDAENVMDLLKQLALSGKLVFVVIHQPSSDIFRMFDQLLMLDTGGYPVYFGNPSDALIYFKRQVHLTDAEESECPVCGNINPEQLFNIIELHVVDEFGNSTTERKITPSEWNDLYKKTEQPLLHEEVKLLEKNIHDKPSVFAQWKVFFTRDLLSRISNRQYMLINLLEAPVLALVLGFILRYTTPGGYRLINNPNLAAYLFIGVIIALFLGLSVSAEEIIRDRKILQREKFLHLSRGSYLVSKVCLLFLISAIQTLSFVLIGNALMGVHDMNFVYWVVLFSTACFANLLGLNISSGLDSAVTIYILIPFLLIPQILLSGVIVRFEKLNPVITSQEGVPLIGNMMASRWAYEALAVEQFANNPFERKFYKYDAIMSRATFKKDWWVPALRERTDKAERMLTLNAPKDSLEAPLALIRNEFINELYLNPSLQFAVNPADLKKEKFNSEVLKKLRTDLDWLREYYITTFNSTNERKEALIENMTSTPEKLEEFNRMKDRYENAELEDMVRNSNQPDRFVMVNNKIIQRFEPVFHRNARESFFGAPLFSATKNLPGKEISTFAANVIVLWLMSVLMYFTLQFDLLRKLLKKLS
jgi:ABC transport system ATP-binding/permease protein